MELTDSWEGVMFALTHDAMERVCIAVGIDPIISKDVHAEMKALKYATMETNSTFGEPFATWHGGDACILVLRGIKNLDNAFSNFTDSNIQKVLDANQQIFQRIRAALPDYASQMNFNPKTASAVLKAFGANISSEMLYVLASKYGTSSCIDLDGRKGVTSAFIRCVTLTLVAILD